MSGREPDLIPPTLTRRRLAALLRLKLPDFPPELIQAAIREVIDQTARALVSGRPVIFRGFGRFQPRRYRSATKRLGLIFRPSPALAARLKPAGPADESRAETDGPA